MEFLADESCAGPVIRALREAGHDVLAIAEIAKGASDEQVLQRAFAERRILVTEDRDFGELVYARSLPSAGVILVRFDTRARHARSATVAEAVSKLGPRLSGAFTVIEAGRVRVSGWPRA
jgi:predicted nuclease of predicted toxin-antitoxin system